MTKETFLFGYAPLSVIRERIERSTIEDYIRDSRWRESMSKGVVLFDRRDILDLTLQRRDRDLLEGICEVATIEGRIDLLDEVFNDMDDENDKRYIFQHSVDKTAARNGKLEVLEWLATKRYAINKWVCARVSARFGHLHILKWLQEEKGLELDGIFYNEAAKGGHLHVMKWLREQEVDWDEWTFKYAARERNLDVLQWLHNEGCPWPRNHRIHESWLKPEVVDWCRVNDYGDRIIVV